MKIAALLGLFLTFSNCFDDDCNGLCNRDQICERGVCYPYRSPNIQTVTDELINQEWPGVVGLKSYQAIDIIRSERPDVDVVVATPGQNVGGPFRDDRVIVYVDDADQVYKTPLIG